MTVWGRALRASPVLLTMDTGMDLSRLCRRVAAIAVLLTASQLQAQSPAERAGLEQLRDSLAEIRDSLSLLRHEARLIAAAKADRLDVMQHLRLGFVALRLGELGGKSHYDDAASEFQWAIDLRPEWPYPWFGMGLAEYGVGDSQVSLVAGIQTMLGKDALTRSALAFAKSAAVDPAFVQGLSELASTALRQRVNIKLNVALDALRRSAATPAGGHPSVLLARGRVEREVGDADSALVAFRRYAATGPNRALGLFEVARTRLLAGDLEGQLAYYEGASSDDSLTVAAYRADLALIAPDSALAKFDAARGGARADMLRRFWDLRDQLDLRTAGSRLAEHHRRYFYARRNFFLAGTNRHYDIVERFRSGSKDFDDRGVIYIRHGAPDARASYQAPSIEPNESWRYSRPDGDLVFHFIAREDVQDYKLVESVFDVLGFSGAVRLQASGQADAALLDERAAGLLLSREQLSPMYSRLQRVGRVSAARYQADERRAGRTSIRIGTTTDSHGLHFGKELPARTEVLAVGRDSAHPLVQVTYAIPGASLEPVPVSRGVLYSVRVRFVALDAAGQVVASLDTTRRFVAAQPVPPREHLLGRVAVAVPPGELTYRLAIQQGEDAGIVLPTDSVRVVAAAPAGPQLSDLVLGSRVADLTWSPAAADTVFFNPLGSYRPTDELRLYYELTGLPPGTGYTTEVQVRKGSGSGGVLKKIFGGGGAAITVKFEERVPATPGVQRSIALDRLKPGQYTLEVTVTDASGRKDRRRREFLVVGK